MVAHHPGGALEAIRSTLIASSQMALAERGLKERYEALVEPTAREELRQASMVAQWVPLRLGLAHYRACDALGLPRDKLLEIGDVVGTRLSGSAFGTLVRVARSGGVSPWVPLGRLDRVWGRIYRGSSIGVVRTGPKDARIELRRNPLVEITYWRVAAEGLFEGVAQLFARKAYVKPAPRRPAEGADYLLSWA